MFLSPPRCFVLVCALALLAPALQAASIEFSSRELFRVPFGKDKEALGVKIENGNFLQ